MDLYNCGRKRAYFFMDKQKRKKTNKTDEKRILCKFTVRYPGQSPNNRKIFLDNCFLDKQLCSKFLRSNVIFQDCKTTNPVIIVVYTSLRIILFNKATIGLVCQQDKMLKSSKYYPLFEKRLQYDVVFGLLFIVNVSLLS